jgi:hypothetical protein
VNDRQLNTLIAMVLEVEDLEGSASAGLKRPSQTLWDRRHAGGSPGIRVAWAAAACVVLMTGLWLLRGTAPDPARGRVATIPVAVRLMPQPPVEPTAEHDTIELQPAGLDQHVMLALVRAWNRDCQCVAWRLHEWGEGLVSTPVVPGAACDISAPRGDSAPVGPVLVLASSGGGEQLPHRARDTEALLACLNETALTPGADQDATQLASAVRSCLPSGVTVVAQSMGGR